MHTARLALRSLQSPVKAELLEGGAKAALWATACKHPPTLEQNALFEKDTSSFSVIFVFI